MLTPLSCSQRICLGSLTGELLAGKLPSGKMRLVQAWIEIHRDELMADWRLAVNGEEVFKIDPLK